jgi:hypothetical protein
MVIGTGVDLRSASGMPGGLSPGVPELPERGAFVGIHG